MGLLEVGHQFCYWYNSWLIPHADETEGKAREEDYGVVLLRATALVGKISGIS
jgi:hypothetical protein